MIGIDTNILIRFVTKDHVEQFTAVQELLVRHKGIPQSIYVNNVVLCELCWVLKSLYKYDAQQIYEAIQDIQNTKEFQFSNSVALTEAIRDFKSNSGDFADYLIHSTNKHKGCKFTYSFDKKMIKKQFFRLLKIKHKTMN